MKKSAKLAIIVSSAAVAALALAVAIPFTVLGIKTASMKADYSYLKNDEKYSEKVEASGLDLVTQHISCGYATIEMISSYYGEKIDEDSLSNKNNGKISTSSSKGFEKEINASIINQHFEMHSYLQHDVMLKEIYVSLKNNNPVAIEWAAKYEDEWTLHYSVVSALDLVNDNVTIFNPYGYIENITIDEFVSRTSFKAYKNIPGFLNFGFAYGAFDKNAIFYAI